MQGERIGQLDPDTVDSQVIVENSTWWHTIDTNIKAIEVLKTIIKLLKQSVTIIIS